MGITTKDTLLVVGAIALGAAVVTGLYFITKQSSSEYFYFASDTYANIKTYSNLFDKVERELNIDFEDLYLVNSSSIKVNKEGDITYLDLSMGFDNDEMSYYVNLQLNPDKYALMMQPFEHTEKTYINYAADVFKLMSKIPSEMLLSDETIISFSDTMIDYALGYYYHDGYVDYLDERINGEYNYVMILDQSNPENIAFETIYYGVSRV